VSLLARFLLYNLLLSLAGGLWAWLLVVIAVRLLDLRSSIQGFCFFSLAIFKSLLLFLGLGLLLPWPARWLEGWHDQALGFRQVLPFFLIWAGAAYLLIARTVRQRRQALLQGAQSAIEAAPQLEKIFEAVVQKFQKLPTPKCSDDLCSVKALTSSPQLVLSEQVNTPLALTEIGEPVILFPSLLVPLLAEAELAGALAHELAHFILRQPDWCSAGLLQKLIPVVPTASLVGEYLHRQEEKACDELAVSLLGEPEVYAGMLTKCFRFAREHPEGSAGVWLQALPPLVGFKPLLSERVEQLVGRTPASPDWRRSPLVVWLVWAALFGLLFFTGY
jgi:beta-lactamase regulating signal transducer with metallopeptidase domain